MVRTLLSVGVRGATLVALALTASVAFAWSGPPGSPTACPSGYAGCDAPLNVGSTAQTKSGTLYVNAAGNAVTGNSTNGNWGGVFYGGGGSYSESSGVGTRGANTSGSNWGGYFTGGYGVYGQASSGYGVYGYSSGGMGVYGQTAANSYGGYFYAPASGAVGLRADGNAYAGYFYNVRTGTGVYLANDSYALYTGNNISANDLYISNIGVWASDLRLSQQLSSTYSIHYGGNGGICPSGSLMVGTTGWWSSYTDVYVYCRNILY